MFCPKCGKENNKEEIFCIGCGLHLKAAVSNTPVQKRVEQKPKKKGCTVAVIIIAIITLVALAVCVAVAGFIAVGLLHDTAKEVPTMPATMVAELVEMDIEEVMSETDAIEASKTLDSLTYDERKKLNIFLSNFSEVHMFNYESGMIAEGYELIRFAYLHNKINNTGNAADGQISAENVNKALEKYFGITIADGTYGVGDIAWVCNDGMYICDRGDYYFEDPLNFTTVTDLVDEGDGLYTVEFMVHQIDENDSALLNKSVYGYSIDKVASNYTAFGEGVAKIREKDGTSTYELVEYQLNTYY